MRTSLANESQAGTTIIEVLVTMVILAIGMLGIAGLQSRLGVSEMESYQRAQALVLLQDMASRISTNREKAADYVTGSGAPLNAAGCPIDTSSRKDIDFMQWCQAIQGAAEIDGGSKAGAMLGARGCVEALSSNEYLVTVAWQGILPVAAPPAGVACAAGSYDTAQCPNDLCRRAVTTVVRIAPLN